MGRVVALHRQAFGANIEEARLRAFLIRILFEHPWTDPELPSLAYVDGEGELIGCLGVMPRPMRLEGEPIRSVVTHDFIVAPGRRGGLAAIQLLRALNAARADIRLADENEISRRISEALGSVALEGRSQRWLRVFSPARLGIHLLEKKKGWRIPPLARRLISGIAVVPDAVLRHAPGSPTRTPRVPRGDTIEHAPEAESLVDVIDRLTEGLVLRPVYTASTMQWLLDTLRATGRDQQLRTAIVRSDGEPVGWFIYYSRTGAVGQVLQIGASRERRRQVLDHLFADAAAQGNVGLAGQVDPAWRRDLESSSCTIRPGSTSLLVQTARPELRRALATSDAFLSRLESEAWLHFAS